MPLCCCAAGASPPLPELSAAEVWKLKCLTLLSLASCAPHHSLAYATLSSHLDLQSTRDVEQLISACIDQSLLDARLDQRTLSLQVHHCAARDVSPGEVEGLRKEVGEWVDRVERLLQQLQLRLREVKDEGQQRDARQAKETEEEGRLRDVLKAHRDSVGAGIGAGMLSKHGGVGGAGGSGLGSGGASDPLMAQAVNIVTQGKDRREGGGSGRMDRDLREGKQRKRGGSSFFGVR